jgi:RNA polymerase sigma-70 factor (ECF subfamily)
LSDDLSDADLLAAGDADAFAQLYDRHAGAVLRWARARTGQYAEDLTAEVFAQAWRCRARFRSPSDGSARPWLYGIAHNVLRSSLRKRRVDDSARKRLGLAEPLIEPGYGEIEARLSFPSAVLVAFASLPEPEREILTLRLVENRPYKDIAERLHCTPVAARLRVSRSLRYLRLSVQGATQ